MHSRCMRRLQLYARTIHTNICCALIALQAQTYTHICARCSALSFWCDSFSFYLYFGILALSFPSLLRCAIDHLGVRPCYWATRKMDNTQHAPLLCGIVLCVIVIIRDSVHIYYVVPYCTAVLYQHLSTYINDALVSCYLCWYMKCMLVHYAYSCTRTEHLIYRRVFSTCVSVRHSLLRSVSVLEKIT